jgi:hypothetical protein
LPLAAQNSTTQTESNQSNSSTQMPKKSKKSGFSGKQSYIGFKGGVNVWKMSDANKLEDYSREPTFKEQVNPGLTGGIALVLGMKKNLALQLETLYNQQGIREGKDKLYYSLNYDYLQVPMLLRFSIGNYGFRPYVNLGAYGAYKLKATTRIKNASGLKTEPETIYKNYNNQGEKDVNFEYGLVGGAGLQFPLGKKLLVLEGRYVYGLNSPKEYKNPTIAPTEANMQSRGLNIQVSYMFRLGK